MVTPLVRALWGFPVILVLVVGLVAARPHTLPVTARDIDGRSWSLLAPPEHQVDSPLFSIDRLPSQTDMPPKSNACAGSTGPRGVRCFAVYPGAPGSVDVAVVKRHRQEFNFPDTNLQAHQSRNRALVRAVAPRVTPEPRMYGPRGRVFRGAHRRPVRERRPFAPGAHAPRRAIGARRRARRAAGFDAGNRSNRLCNPATMKVGVALAFMAPGAVTASGTSSLRKSAASAAPSRRSTFAGTSRRSSTATASSVIAPASRRHFRCSRTTM